MEDGIESGSDPAAAGSLPLSGSICSSAPATTPVAELPAGIVTFLFTDLEGSTRLWEEQPEAMRAALAMHDELLRDAIEAHVGHVVKSTGDGVFAVFANAHDGVGAAVAAQLALAGADWPEGVG